MAFSPRSEYIIESSFRGLNLWRLGIEGEPPMVFVPGYLDTPFKTPNGKIALSSDEKRIVAGSKNTTRLYSFEYHPLVTNKVKLIKILDR